MKIKMKIPFKVITALFILVASSTSLLYAQNNSYKLMWEDNFNKNKLDASKWITTLSDKGGGNKELQYYLPKNISIEKEPNSGESCLVITAKKESYKGRTSTSGHLTTDGKMNFTYGKVEARIKMPKTADGLWPAFWMLGSDHKIVDWPKCGEIDIAEMGKETGILTNTQDRYFNGACHWGESWNGGSYPNKGISTTNDYSLQDGFHTYTLFWTPDSITMYLDLDKFPNAKPYFDMPINDEGNENQTSKYFRKSFYLIFNLAVGGTFSDIYDINEVTALNNGDVKMFVDYVKVFQKGDANEEFITKKKKCFTGWFGTKAN